MELLVIQHVKVPELRFPVVLALTLLWKTATIAILPPREAGLGPPGGSV